MKTRPTAGTHPFEIREEDIQKCAYFLWNDLGCPSGRDLDLWLTARELLNYSAAARPRAARKNCARMAKMRGATPRVFG
jgi:hypothetical protein